MLRLLRRDIDWLITFSLGAIFAYSALLFDARAETLFIIPDGRDYEDLFVTHVTVGLIVGLFIGLRDRLTGTEDYVRHRAVSSRRLFWSQALFALVAITLWYLLPLMARRLWGTEANSGLGPISNYADLGAPHWSALLSHATALWSFFAVGVYAAQAPGGYVAKLVQGSAAAGALLLLDYWMLGETEDYSPLLFASLQIAIAAMLLLSAQATLSEWNDRDRPGTARAAGWNLALQSLAWGTLAVAGAAAGFDEAQDELQAEWPSLHHDEIGWALVRQLPRPDKSHARELVPVGHDHEEIERPGSDFRLARTWIASALGQPHWSQRAAWADARRRGFGVSHGLVSLRTKRWAPVQSTNPREIRSVAFLVHVFLDTRTGVVWRWSDDNHQCELIARPDGRVFTKETIALGSNWDYPGGPALWDRSDGTLWIFDADPTPSLARVSTPKDEEFSLAEVVTKIDPGGPPLRELNIKGRHGIYRLVDQTLERVEPDAFTDVSWTVDLQVDSRDPLNVDILVHDFEGATLFEHRWALRTSQEKRFAAAMMGTTLVRPPVSNLVSWLIPHRQDAQAPQNWNTIDPLLRGGQRLWLVGLAFLVTLSSSLMLTRRLRRLGASPTRRRSWFLAGLVAGPLMWIPAWIVERPRAYVAWPEGSPPRPLLVGSPELESQP
ncbi:MAG: hypothetical protein KDB53_09355 [Planctomycetes bacterium]|nr:hypothetical protein [Planctomycetota bacterium]